MNRLIGQAASQYQPKDRERFIQYVQQEPMAAAQLRAPLYEDKVVDFLFSKAEITERAVEPRRDRSRPRERGRPCPRPGLRTRHSRGQAGQGEKGGREARQGRSEAKPAEPAKGSVEPAAKSAKPKPAEPVKKAATKPAPSQGRCGKDGSGEGRGKAAPAQRLPAKAKPPRRPRRPSKDGRGAGRRAGSGPAALL